MDDQNKTDPASEHKLKKARKQGQASRSQDLTYMALLMGCAVLVFGIGGALVRDSIAVLSVVLSNVSGSFSEPAVLLDLLHRSAEAVSYILLVPLLVLFFFTAFGCVAQVGWVISFDPLVPDFSRINPVRGFEKMLSMRSVFEVVRSTAKIVAVVVVFVAVGAQILPGLVGLASSQPSGVVAYLLRSVGLILVVLLGMYSMFAALDYSYNRWDFLRRMRMSKQEVKDEYKQREGDPRVKSRLRQLRLEWLKKTRALQRTGEADLLLINPTHLAVAISYKRGKMVAPVVLAKGAGLAAEKMKIIARGSNIPIIENVALTRAIYSKVGPDEALPEQFYLDVARLLAWVFANRASTPT